jgi:diguanylate cyclase (GGDEF)-like protein/PAS domain S-box-containing protein
MVNADKRGRTSRLERDNSRLKDSVRQHVRTEKSLETERDLVTAAVKSADAFILVLDRAGRILQANRTVELATGYADDDLLGRKFISVLPIRAAAASFDWGLRRLAEGAVAYPFESHWVSSTGERLLVAGSLTPLRDADGALSHVVVTASDVTQSRALEDELRALSLRDDMTGLHNRRGFSLLAEQRLKDDRRSESTLTIIYADVDHLKSINDSFGHNAGDIALVLCAQALEETFRESDIVARIEGDEFVVLAEKDTRDLDTVARRLDQALDRRAAASGLRFPVSLTIGSAHSRPPHELSMDDMLKQAGHLMCERKHHAPRKSA